MRLAWWIITAALPLPMLAQSFPCKGSFVGSTQMKGIYGGNTTVFQLHLGCRNASLTQSQPISGTLIDLAMQSIPTVPDGLSSVLLAQAFANQPSQRFANDATLGLGVLGALEGAGGKLALIGAGPFGWIVAGVVTATQYLIKYFTKTAPGLTLTTQCPGTNSPVVIPAGGTFECDKFVPKPPKDSARLPSTINFDLLGPWAPVPLPPPPPVQLSRPPQESQTQKLLREEQASGKGFWQGYEGKQ